jgi:hypothetical protein
MHISNHALWFGIATMLGVCAVAPGDAASVLSNTAALKSAADSPVTEVRYIRRGWARAAVAAGVGLAVARTAASYAYGYPYSYGSPPYGYAYSGSGYPASYGYTAYSGNAYGYAPSGYNNYGYGGYSYNYGYAPGYVGYGVRGVARGIARRAYYRR